MNNSQLDEICLFVHCKIQKSVDFHEGRADEVGNFSTQAPAPVQEIRGANSPPERCGDAAESG